MELFTEMSEAATAPPEPESPCHQTWLHTIRLHGVGNATHAPGQASRAARWGGAVLSTIEWQSDALQVLRVLNTHWQQHAAGAARHLAASVAHVGFGATPQTRSLSS